MIENSATELRQWWRALDVSWHRIFKRELDINHNPTDEELREIVELEGVNGSSSRIISLEPLQALHELR